MANRILRISAVMEKTGLSRSSIYLRVNQGRFPKSISLGSRAIGWIEAEIDEWVEQQIERSRNAVT